MRNLLRGLAVAAVLAVALVSVPAAKALPVADTQEICTSGSGHCSASGLFCVTSGQCGAGQRCVCD
jgi:hypothetical protein